jgi:ATP-binding cassette subfamily B protein
MNSADVITRSRDERALQPYAASEHGNAYLSLNTFTRFVALLWAYPAQLLLSAITLLIAMAATLAIPRLLGFIVDLALIPGDRQMLRYLGGIFVCIESLRLLAGILQGILFGRLGLLVMHDLRVRLLDHVMHLKTSSLDTYSTGAILSRITYDTASLSQVFTTGIVGIVEKALVVVGIVVVLFVTNPKLTVMALALFPVLTLGGVLMNRALFKYTRDIREKTGAITAYITESLNAHRILRLFDLQELQTRRFSILNDWLGKSQLRPQFLNALFHPAMTLVNATTVALLMWIGGGMVQRADLPLGVLVSFITYILWLFWPVMHFVNQWNVVVAGLAAAERVFEVLSWPTEEPETRKRDLALPKGEIVFDHVWFAYKEPDWVLKDLSFVIRAGERVGVVGPTGAGKTTILALMFRLYEPQRGTILLDGVPLSEWPREQLREYIALVQQDGALFDGSIADNVSMYGLRSLPEASFFDHIGIRDLTRSCQDLSAGETQWVLFARAAARAPALWILDEAAAHLDPELDLELHRQVSEQGMDKTVLVVAHRLSSVRDLDSVIVLHQGRLLERGSHAELVQAGGLYARMVTTQER